MRAAIRDDRIRNRTITAYIDKDKFREDLEIPDEETIYWFLVQKDTNNILERGYGVISDQELELIKSY